MKIGELAAAAGVSRDTIRHYLSLGLLVAGKDPENGYQIFGTEALSRLRFIRTARQLGFSLGDIRDIFGDADRGDSPCPRVRHALQDRIVQTRREIAELTRLCDHMEEAMAEWEAMPDSAPDGHSVCRLIESQITSPAGEPARREGSSCHEA